MSSVQRAEEVPRHSHSTGLATQLFYVLAAIPLLFGVFVYAWPRYGQVILTPSNDIQTICATKIYTSNANQPLIGCFAYSTKTGLFTDVGSESSMLEKYGSDNVKRMEGNITILPGLHDAHGHIMHYGEMLESVNLFGADSIDEITKRIREWLRVNERWLPLLKSGKKWLVGFGWDQNILPGAKYPTADGLDLPDLKGIKVKLCRNDVHCVWVSNPVLDMLDLPEEIPGGEIIRDPGMGVLCDTAATLVENISPNKTDDEIESMFKAAMKDLNSVGLVGVHEASVFPRTLKIYQKLADEGELTLRIYAMVDCPPMNGYCPEQVARLENYANGFLSVRSVKLFADGALGSWGAAMIEDYSDKPGNKGTPLLNYTNLETLVRQWQDIGFQVNIHAIGDLANRYALHAFNAVLPNTTTHLRNAHHRHRIEHAQILHPDDVLLSQQMGIIVSMQPTHATTDMSYALSRLGPERLENGAYAQATFARNPNTTLILGSDFPVEPPSPIRGLFAAIRRLDPDTGRSPHGGEGWYSEQRLEFQEALRGFTLDAAYGGFQEGWAGSIEVGKWADWVVVEEVGLGVEMGEGVVRETWVGGKKVFG